MVIVVGIICFVLGEWCGVLAIALATAAKNRDSLLEERSEVDEKSEV